MQLKAAAQYKKSRYLRNVDREVYIVNQGGYDMHGGNGSFHTSSRKPTWALSAFVHELKSQGVWDDTVILMGSDFGRSVEPNSNGGTDHAWGGHYFMI